MMKRFIPITLLTCSSILAFGQYVPPDFYGEGYNKSIGFWSNQGQVIDTDGNLRPDVRYYSEGSVPRLFLLEDRMSFVLNPTMPWDTTAADTAYRVDMVLKNEGYLGDPIAWVQKDNYKSFYLNHCGTDGVREVAGYSRLIYEDIYDRVDLHLYSGSVGQKMAFVIRPGGDPSAILLGFNGHDSLSVDIAGVVKIYKKQKYIKLDQAVAYQVGAFGNLIPLGWNAQFELAGAEGTVRFTFNGAQYNPELPLVLQIGPPPYGPIETPGVCWSTYFGGDAEDLPSGGLEASKDGTLYLSGYTKSSEITFPSVVGVNAFQAYSVTFLTQFDALHELNWSAYYGGNYNTYAHGLTLKDEGNPLTVEVYVVGSTQATQLFLYPQSGAYNSSTGPVELNTPVYFKGFIAKFDYFGNVQWSTYFGDNTCNSCELQIYGGYIQEIQPTKKLVIGGLHAVGLPSPTTNPPSSYTVYPSNGFGNSDGFVALFDENDQLYWSTSVGGELDDQIIDVRVNAQKIVAVGLTISDDVPTVPNGVGYFDDTYNGGTDMILWEFNSVGSHVWGTYFGGEGFDVPGELGAAPWVGATNPLGLSAGGDIYIVGRTSSLELPLVNSGGIYIEDPSRCFATRFSGTTRELKWSTYLGTFNIASVLPVANSRVLIGASTAQPGEFSTVPFSSLYYREEPYLNGGPSGGYADGAILLLDNSQSILWSTHFGGVSFQQERIFAWTSTDDEYICTGQHRKYYSDLMSYFPLSSGGYYDWSYNDGGQGDVFVSAFCYGTTVGVAEQESDAEGLEVLSLGGGRYRVISDASSDLAVWNAIGQCVLYQKSAGNGRVIEFSLEGRGEGIYVVQVGLRKNVLVHAEY